MRATLFIFLLALVAVAQGEHAQKTKIQVVASESARLYGAFAVQASVHIITADGSHVALHCDNYWQWRRDVLDQGFYDADQKDDVYWTRHQDKKGHTHRVKYHVSGNW
ncbi:MAG: hypothetical protein ACLPVW_02845 [Terriglobales bacterium]